MRTLLLTASLIVVTIAGCISDGTDDPDVDAARDYTLPGAFATPSLVCRHPLDTDDDQGQPILDAPATRCNFEMTPDAERQGNEVTIGVNPTDPRNIVGGAKDYYPPDAGDCVWDGVYVTHDGGRTAYQDRSFDGSPWRLYNGDIDGFQPNYASQFWCTTDPVSYFDVNGNLYYLLMAYQADPITGSKLGEDFFPLGGLNDWAFNRAVQIVAVSDDGGDTFHTFSPILEGSFPIAFHDKGWIAASDDGTIHVGWLAFVEGNVYFRSTDGGQTWLDAELIAPFVNPLGVGGGQGTFIDVGPGPEVYFSWAGSDTGGDGAYGAALRRSFDYGETFDEARIVAEMVPTDMNNGLEGRDRRDLQFPALATDRNPDSPYAGGIYFVWQDGREGTDDSPDSSIYFSGSHDDGETFSSPIKISDARTGTYQFFPAVSVSPGGVIDVTWLDMRNDVADDGTPNNVRIDQYYTYSLDGGETWAPNFHVRDIDDGGWHPQYSHHQNGMNFIGDYIDIDSSWEAAHPVWPDTRSESVVDVYTATIKRPMFSEGWDAAGIEAALQWVAEHPL